jgi:hypothetical protein
VTKPTPDEVEEYGATISFPIDGEAFCDFYKSKGWKIGTSPMVNWQAAVRTWKRKAVESGRLKLPNKRFTTVNPNTL